MRISAQQTTFDERLRIRIVHGGPDAVKAAIALMERHDPVSPDQALELVSYSDELSPLCREVVMEAWDRYFHIRNMSWE